MRITLTPLATVFQRFLDLLVVRDEGMPKSKLYKILPGARSRNAFLDVTGLLVFVNGVFLQILEGERDAVSALID